QNASVPSHRQAWLDELSKSRSPSEPVESVRIPLQQDSGTTAQVAVTKGMVAADAKSVAPKSSDDLFGKCLVFEGKQHLDYSGRDFPAADKPFSWAVWVKPPGAGAILSRMDSSQRERGVDLSVFADRKIGMHVIADWPSNAMKVLTIQPLPADRWSHVIATYDGGSKGAGVAIYVNGEKQNLQIEVDKLSGSATTDQPFRVGMRSGNSPL